MTLLRTVDLPTLRARGTIKWTAYPHDVLAMWIAESDFDTCPAVMDAVKEGMDKQCFGYPAQPPQLGAAVGAWCRDQYQWTIDEAAVFAIPDVVRGLSLALRAFTSPNATIIIPVPAYMPFFGLMEICERTPHFIPMVKDESGRWVLDTAEVDKAFAEGAEGIILCNPYNPLGTAFTADELKAITDLAHHHGARVFSDEIHNPLVYDRPHIPTASVSDKAAAATITITATSKGWNTAGLKCAQIIFTNPDDVHEWKKIHYLLKQGTSTLGQLAAIAAYDNGREWLAEELTYLRENRDFLIAELSAIPGIEIVKPEATFLLWINFNDVEVPGHTGADGSPQTFCQLLRDGGPSPARWLLENAKVAVSDGADFAGDALAVSDRDPRLAHGQGCVRLNFATSREICRQAVDSILRALDVS